MTGSAAALVSFAEASGLLAELAGGRVEAKQVERVAEALGREIAAAEREGTVEPEPASAPTRCSPLPAGGCVNPSGPESRQRAGGSPLGSVAAAPCLRAFPPALRRFAPPRVKG